MISELNISSLETIFAPDSMNSASENLASTPAPFSMVTLKPSFVSNFTAAGDSATRRSLGRISLGIPIVKSE